MGKLADAANVLKLLLHWQVGADLNVSTRLFNQYTGSPPSSNALLTWLGQVNTAANANLVPLLGPGNLYKGSSVQDLTSVTSGQASAPASNGGTRTGGILPASACVLFNVNIARRYRGGKPRYYFPWGVTQDLATEQQWTSTFTALCNTNMNAFLAAIQVPVGSATVTNTVNVSFYSGVHSYIDPGNGRGYNKPIPRVGQAVIDTVVGRTVNPFVGSQRRRIGA